MSWIKRLLKRLFKEECCKGKCNSTKGGIQMETRYDVVALDSKASQAKKLAKADFIKLESTIKANFPQGRARSQAILKLEEAYAWVSKAARVATEERSS